MYRIEKAKNVFLTWGETIFVQLPLPTLSYRPCPNGTVMQLCFHPFQSPSLWHECCERCESLLLIIVGQQAHQPLTRRSTGLKDLKTSPAGNPASLRSSKHNVCSLEWAKVSTSIWVTQCLNLCTEAELLSCTFRILLRTYFCP